MKVNNIVPSLMAAVALLAFSLPVAAFAEMNRMPIYPGDGHGQMMEMGHMDRMDNMMGMCMTNADKLGFTDEQTAKLKPLHNEMQKKQARYKADLKIAEIELKEVMEVKDFDLEKAGIGVKKIADIKTAHQMETIKAMKEIRSVLTDDQFKKMSKMMPMDMGSKKHPKRTMKK